MQQNPYNRWSDHKSSITHNKGCPLLSKAFKKYGKDSFKFEILIICFDEDRYEYEKEYIKKYNTKAPNGYNLTDGGEPGGNFKGRHHTFETKQILKDKAIVWNNNPEIKERARERAREFNRTHNIGELQKKSEKWKKAVEEGRIGNRGGEKDNETKYKISEGLKRYFENNGGHIIDKEKHSKIMTKINGRKIGQYSKDNELIAKFDSIILAEKKTDVNKKTIQASAAGRLKTGGGFIWKYID